MSDFMKDIANQAKTITIPEKPNELDILSRSVKPAIKVEKKEPIQEQEISEPEQQVDEVQPVLDKLIEEPIPVSKPPYPDGATATNPTTGEQIIFSGGVWQSVDAG